MPVTRISAKDYRTILAKTSSGKVSAEDVDSIADTGEIPDPANPLTTNAKEVDKPTDKKQQQRRAQIRIPKQRVPNKTEAEWRTRLEAIYPGAEIRYEPVTLHLPSGTRYRPDWMVVTTDNKVIFYEVKGAHIHDPKGSIRALKEAISTCRYWTFFFAQKREEGWAVEPREYPHDGSNTTPNPGGESSPE